MNERTQHAGTSRRRRFSTLSPAGWVVRAIVLLGLFTVMHLLGWREYTNVLSGTMGLTTWTDYLRAAAGGLYLLGWLAATVVVPILIIGAVIFAALLRWTRRASA